MKLIQKLGEYNFYEIFIKKYLIGYFIKIPLKDIFQRYFLISFLRIFLKIYFLIK